MKEEILLRNFIEIGEEERNEFRDDIEKFVRYFWYGEYKRLNTINKYWRNYD
jgi:hypothetical protein